MGGTATAAIAWLPQREGSWGMGTRCLRPGVPATSVPYASLRCNGLPHLSWTLRSLKDVFAVVQVSCTCRDRGPSRIRALPPCCPNRATLLGTPYPPAPYATAMARWLGIPYRCGPPVVEGPQPAATPSCVPHAEEA